jgi:acyl-CoA reductase-like NAD-dependent aldehyde dehydrogenase
MALHPGPTSRPDLDASLAALCEHSAAWASLCIDDRIDYLRLILRGTLAVAPALVADAVAAKGNRPEMGADDWIAGIIPLLRTVRYLADTLEGIRRTGRVPLSAGDITTRPDGQLVARVAPGNGYDRLLYTGVTADVWFDPGVALGDLDSVMGSFYTKGGSAVPKVVGVLGAGNVASIGPLDMVHQLFVEGAVAILKLNPVNDYLGSHLERVFADLIADGFVDLAHGGAEVGEYLVHHPLVDAVHITGSIRSHDAIVFGAGPEGAARKTRGEPQLNKPITSELGNVSPVIVVPGKWSERDLRFRAEELATEIVQNSGFNCNGARVLVLAEGWSQREAFLGHLGRVLASLPSRPSYYPGAAERYEHFSSVHDKVAVFGERRPGFLPTALLLDVPPTAESLAFTEEAFCSMAATTLIPGSTPAEFLDRAVGFCNEHLEGTLNVTVVVDPQTRKSLGPALGLAVSALRYGTVAVNIWAAAGFVLGTPPWGAFPGNTLGHAGSGIGFVHNARLIDRPQKTVIRGFFWQYPKPVWFVTHRNAHRVLPRVARLEASPALWRLPAVVGGAIRG